jgi:hypothetical protein
VALLRAAQGPDRTGADAKLEAYAAAECEKLRSAALERRDGE